MGYTCGVWQVWNLLSPTMKWTGPIFENQRLTEDQIISSKGELVRGTLQRINPEGTRCFYIWK